MDRISKKGNAHSVSTFDFSTLYTKIPQPRINFCNVFNFSLIWSLLIRTESTFLVPILEPTGFLVQDVLTEGTLRTRCHLHLSFLQKMHILRCVENYFNKRLVSQQGWILLHFQLIYSSPIMKFTGSKIYKEPNMAEQENITTTLDY